MTTTTISNPPNAADWTRTAANAQHVEQYVNGPAATLTSPGGTARDSLSKVQADVFANYRSLNLRGNWVTATAYAVRDLYLSAGIAYIVLVAHTSSASVATDLAAGRVQVYQGALASDVATRLAIDQNFADVADKGVALRNLGLIDNNSPIPLTGTTTLTLAQLNRGVVLGDGGSPVSYTMTLPSAAPIGALIKIRVAGDATRLYTINGGDVAIDGRPNRVLWRGEAVLLERISGGWTKIGGVSRPFRGYARRTTNQALTADTINRVAFDSVGGDSTGLNLWWDAANARVIPPRESYYRIGFNAVLSFNGELSHVEFGIQQVNNDVSAPGFTVSPPGAFVDIVGPGTSGARTCCSISGYYSANAIGGWHGVVRPNNSAGTIEFVPGILETDLMITEVPLW